MRTLDRYLLSEMIPPFLVGISIVIGMLVGNTLFALLSIIFKNNLWGFIPRLIVFNIPSLLVLTLPVGTAIAAALAVNRHRVHTACFSGQPRMGLLKKVHPIGRGTAKFRCNHMEQRKMQKRRSVVRHAMLTCLIVAPALLAAPVRAQQNGQVTVGPARFTVITPECVRMEYAPKNGFVDSQTLFAFDRNAVQADAIIKRTDGGVTIDTAKMHLDYHDDGQPFNPHNLSVTFALGQAQGSWTPGQADKNNLGGPVATLDNVSGPIPLPPGLISRSGWSLIDDSGNPILVNEWIASRSGGDGANSDAPGTHNADKDWYLFAYGTDYAGALRSLAAVSGPVAMPRKEVLGSWYCRWHKYTADDFRQIVREYKEHDFPQDILVMDMDWHLQDAKYGYGHADNLGWTGYTWNRQLIPDPDGLLREFKNDGIFVTLNDHPADGVRDTEESYPAFMKMLDQTPAPGNNLPFDAGDRRYMDAFFQAAHVPLERQGVDFWWVDWQQDYIYPSVYGVPGLRHLPWLNQLYYEHSEADGRRGQNYSRWGGWGDQRHPIQFSGDASANWNMLAFEVPFTLASGNAGCFFWAHDTGGFYGERNPETFTRWVQFSALSAALRVHSVGDDLDRRPWLWGAQYEDAMRAAYHLRARLFPYIYTSVRQCHDLTLPLLRPMYITYPDQDEAYAHPGEYLFGDNLLAAPIVTPGKGANLVSQQTVWFPPGTWFNVFTGEKITGGQTLTVSAALDEIPLYARSGTPIPMQPDTLRMTTTPLSTLVVRCYPGTSGNSQIYEDDGESQGYLHGQWASTGLHYRRIGNTVRVVIDPAHGRYSGEVMSRGYRIELPCTMKATRATLDGKPVAVTYDESNRMNTVSVPPRSTSEGLTIVVQAAEVDPSLAAQKAAMRRQIN